MMKKLGGLQNERPPSTGGGGGFGEDKGISEDFGVYDRSSKSWLRGYVGGEVPGGECRFGDEDDWDGDEGSYVCEAEKETGYYAPGFSKADCRRGFKVIR